MQPYGANHAWLIPLSRIQNNLILHYGYILFEESLYAIEGFKVLKGVIYLGLFLLNIFT